MSDPSRDTASASICWLMRLLALAGGGITGYLLTVSLAKLGLPAGCGGGSGCAEVLSSRWSVLFGLPVSAPALGVYAGILLCTFSLGPRVSPRARKVCWTILLALGSAVFCAAVWFTALQWGVLGAVCPWCLADHLVGLTLAIVVFVSAPVRWSGAPSGDGRVPVLAWTGAVMLGLFSVGLLAAGQALFESKVSQIARLPADRNADTGPGPSRMFSVLNGSLQLAPAEEPLLGSPDAPKMLVVMFDYCCPHCRAAHGQLVQGLEKYPGQYAVVLLPVPLDRKCNPHVDETEPRFEHACELARLALAVWKAKPSAFHEFDLWLFEPEQPRDPQSARDNAEALVGRAELDAALNDGSIDKILSRNVEAYHRSEAPRIPVILSPSFPAIVGRPSDEAELFGILEKELPLTAP